MGGNKPSSNQQSSTINQQIQQSAPDNYHNYISQPFNATTHIAFTSLGLQNLGTEGNLENSFFSSKKYLSHTAATKQKYIWSQVVNTSNTSGSFPSALKMPGIFIESMEPTFSTVGDTMPKQGIWPLKHDRPKFIHSVGTVGKVKFVPSTPGFSGLFKGAEHGIVRFSSAAKPTKGGHMGPGLGLKFLRDGMDSANLVAMFSVEGQPGDWNFFSKDFTTIIGASDQTALKVLSMKFATATDWIQVAGLSDMASYQENGKKEANIEVPFGLRFKPHADVHTLFPSAMKEPMSYIEQTESVPANSTLYEVYGLSGPKQTGGKEFHIGNLVLDGSLTKSKWGDESLFFRHQKADDDVKVNPQWGDYLPSYKLGGKCPFMAADAPKSSWWPFN